MTKKVKPVKPGSGTAKGRGQSKDAQAEARTTRSAMNRNESRQTRGMSLNRNESRQTRGGGYWTG